MNELAVAKMALDKYPECMNAFRVNRYFSGIHP
jgi:hypothetical protein